MSDKRQVRRRWRRFLMIRWGSLLSLLFGGVVLATAIILGAAGLLMQLIPKPTLVQNWWMAAGGIAAFVAALIALIFASAWCLHRTAAACGMVCGRCGLQFDLAALEYVDETGECPACVIHRISLQSAGEAPESQDAFSFTKDDEPPNPYAPPRAERAAPQPVVYAPPATLHLNSIGAHLFRIVMLTYLGWLAVVIILGLAVLGVVNRLFLARLPAESPTWLKDALKVQRRGDLALIFGCACLAIFLFAGGIFISLLFSHTHPTAYASASHFIAGAAVGIAVSCGDVVFRQRKRRGRVTLPHPQWNCAVYLTSAIPWSQACRAVRFRPHGFGAITVLIVDTLTGEQYAAETVACENLNGWNTLRLPLDELAARGINLQRLNIWLHPLDGKPWMYQYDEYAKTVRA